MNPMHQNQQMAMQSRPMMSPMQQSQQMAMQQQQQQMQQQQFGQQMRPQQPPEYLQQQSMMNRPTQQVEMPSSGQDDQQRPPQAQRPSSSSIPTTSTTSSDVSANAPISASSPALQQQQQQQQQQQDNPGQSLSTTTPSTTATAPSSGSMTTTSTANSAGGASQPNQQPLPQQQQQHQQPPPPQQQSREINTATVCKIGQETVQEIVGRIQEVFNYLKTLQPPVGNPNTDRATLEKQQRLNEVLKGIARLFKRLHVCWDKAQEHSASGATGDSSGSSMELTDIEALVPLKDGPPQNGLPDVRGELEKRRGDSYRAALEEHNELASQLVMKNKHLKEIIDQMRNLIWEINTMLAMREG